jgi:hypothetical protein
MELRLSSCSHQVSAGLYDRFAEVISGKLSFYITESVSNKQLDIKVSSLAFLSVCPVTNAVFLAVNRTILLLSLPGKRIGATGIEY